VTVTVSVIIMSRSHETHMHTHITQFCITCRTSSQWALILVGWHENWEIKCLEGIVKGQIVHGWKNVSGIARGWNVLGNVLGKCLDQHAGSQVSMCSATLIITYRHTDSFWPGKLLAQPAELKTVWTKISNNYTSYPMKIICSSSVLFAGLFQWL